MLWTEDNNLTEDFKNCDLLLTIHCNNVSTSDLVRFMQEDLLPETMTYCDPHKLYSLLEPLRIIWLFDGLDEATESASVICRRLINSNFDKHMIIITTRPEHSYPWASKLVSHNLLEINLIGIDPLEASRSIVLRDGSKLCGKDVNKFSQDFQKLDIKVQLELQNPLKLQLALQAWKQSDFKLQHGFDLPKLYEMIRDVQVDSLVKKQTQGKVLEGEARKRVKKWFSFLCEMAFEMTRRKKVTVIDCQIQEKLEDYCISLNISPSDCCSTFLAYQKHGKTQEYSFFHSTQQYFLAAHHAAPVFDSAKDFTELCKLFGVNCIDSGIESEELVHFYEVLLHVTFLVGESLSDERVQMLIKLFRIAINGNDDGSTKWLEIVRKSSYNIKFLSEISEVIPSLWIIDAYSVTAARVLLEFSNPHQLVIRIEDNPNHINDLKPLLRTVAECYVWVSLFLSYHYKSLSVKNRSDKFLKLLCQEDSVCHILGFAGYLSIEGYDLLKASNLFSYCDNFNLKVKTSEELYKLSKIIGAEYFFREFRINLALKDFSYKSITLPKSVDLALPHMTDSNALDAAKLIARLSHSFNSIVVHDLSLYGVKKFVLHLKEKGVRVKDFIKEITKPSLQQKIRISYGSLPLHCPLEDFLLLWLDGISQIQDSQTMIPISE